MFVISRALALYAVTSATLIMAAANATQNVSVAISAINQISVDGNVSLTINNATAGSELNSVSDSTATLSFTTNAASTKKITAATSSNLPTGISLSVHANLDATGARVNTGSGVSATSAGSVTLSTTAATVVSNVNKAIVRNAPLTYTLTAEAGAGELSSTALTITYTITNA